MVDNEEGESAKLFTIQAVIEGETYGIGRDYNKKNAEKLAAEKTCEALSISYFYFFPRNLYTF